MSFGRLEEELKNCLEQYPPDFDGARELLQKGADINAADYYGDVDTLLSEIICGYPAFTAMNPCEDCIGGEDCDSCEYRGARYDSSYMPKIIEFFLENGYDVMRGDGLYGALALFSLCYSSYDKTIIDAAKILLDAGADPLFVIEDDVTPLNTAGICTSAGIAVDNSLELECLFWILCDILEAKTKGEPYTGIQWNDVVIGKRIDRVYSCAKQEENAIYDVTMGEHHYSNVFKDDIVLECEGIPLRVTHYCHAYVNPYQLPDESAKVDVSGYMNGIIGKRIKEFHFSVNKIHQDRTVHSGSTLEIKFDDETTLVIKDNGDSMDEEYCAYFKIMD